MNLLLQPQWYRGIGTRITCASLALSLFAVEATFAVDRTMSAGTSRGQWRTKLASITVTGTVKDAQGLPLPGANLVVKGTKFGTVTNAKGSFTIDLPKGDEILVVSSVGFKSKEVPVSGKTTLDIQLDDDVAAINEVVVVGYGTQKKIHLTGAVASVDMQKVQDLPVGSLSAALVSQLPGVGVAGGTSRPGDNAQITVRNPIVLSKDGGRFGHCM